MARPGPQPKATPKHGHGGAGWRDYPKGFYTGPGSEQNLPDMPGMAWWPQIIGWWNEVRRMPHCTDWTPTDWIFAIETALFKNNVYAEFFGGTVHATMITEIRRREDQMGCTDEARRKLGIRYVEPAQVAAQDDETETPAEPGATTGDAVRPIGSARSRRQQLAV